MEHFKLFFIVASFLFPLALCLVFFSNFRKNISQKIMAFILLNSSFVFLCNYLYFQQDYTIYYPFHSLNAAIQFSLFPLIYLYIRSIVFPKDKFKTHLIHLLPSVIMLLVATYIFYIYTSKDDLIYFLKNNRQGVHFEEYKFFVLRVSRYIHLILIALQGLLYSLAFIKFPKEYDEKLQNEFSNIDKFSIDWINKYLLTFAIIVASGFIIYAIYPLKGLADFTIKLIFLVFSGYVCRLGILALQHQTLEIDLDVIVPVILIEKDVAQIKDDILIRKLDLLMTKKQVFLQPDLSLTSLSKDLGTNRTYLSMLINQQYNANFNGYINGLRTDFAKEYIINNPSVNKEELYTIAGFGSLSTMNRALSTNKITSKTNKI